MSFELREYEIGGTVYSHFRINDVVVVCVGEIEKA